MADKRFYNKKKQGYKLSEIIGIIKCQIFPQLKPDNDILIYDIKTLEESKSGDLTFLTNKKYAYKFKNTGASACIVPEDLVGKIEDKQIFLLVSKNSYLIYKQLIDLFYTRAKTYSARIMPSAYVSSSAKIGKNCYIGHNVVIEDHCVIGDDCIIEAGSFIDYGVVIGSRAMIYSNVSISYSIIGNDVVILPGAKIGQDGFGFASDAGLHHKIFHTGLVRIGNDVEIGANSTIDRGSLSDTIIEDCCRIDNLVQIGHNVRIGKGSIIVAQAGIAGSSEVGKYCAVGGQAGIAGHLNIGDKTQIAAQSGVMRNIESGAIVGGTPSLPIRDWHKQSIILKDLLKKNS